MAGTDSGRTRLLVISIYGTKLAARKWHTHISFGWCGTTTSRSIARRQSSKIPRNLIISFMAYSLKIWYTSPHVMNPSRVYAEVLQRLWNHRRRPDGDISGDGTWSRTKGTSNQVSSWFLNPASAKGIQGIHQEDAGPQEGAVSPGVPGVSLKPDDVPAVPDRRKQSYYPGSVQAE